MAAYGFAVGLLIRFVGLCTWRSLRAVGRARPLSGAPPPVLGESASSFDEFTDELNRRCSGEPAEASALRLSEQRAVRQARLYEALSKTNQVISIRLPPQELAEAICRICVSTQVAKFAWIGVLEGSVLTPTASAGWPDVPAPHLLTPLASLEPTSMTVREGVSCVVDEVDALAWMNSPVGERAGWTIACAGAFPIFQQGAVMAVLTLYCADANAFDGTLLRLLEEMASDASFGLDNYKRESQLREREMQLDAIVETAMEAIVTADASLNVVVCNAAARAMFRVTAADVLGEGIGRLIPARRRQARLIRLRDYIGSAADEAPPNVMLRLTGERADGSLFPMHAAVSRVGVAGMTLVTLVVRDESGVHAAEAARLSALAAETANKAKTDFLSRMSHELWTPLNAVASFSKLLAETAHDRLHDGERQQLNMIHLAGNQLGALIDDVLDVSRIEAGHMPVNLVDVGLTELLNGVLEFCQLSATTGGIRLIATYASSPSSHIRSDPVRLHQIMSNLVSNAIKYNRSGGEVRVEVLGDLEFVAIRVSDDGLGMSEEQMAGLFEPFNRLGRERGVIAGTGIGLMLSRQLVALLGGTLDVESVQGRGTHATVTLRNVHPARSSVRSISDRPDAKVAAPTASEPRGRVVYIEDNPVNVLIVRELLSRWAGVEPFVATDGETGLEMVFDKRPDLLLLDMYLPGISGMEVLAILRRDARTMYLPIVALSASAMRAEASEALRFGINEYWSKPIDFPCFLEGVSGYLKVARAADSNIDPVELRGPKPDGLAKPTAKNPTAKKLILIADDYEDAGDALAALLDSQLDCESVVAMDGEEALQMALARRPDVAILDLDMPRLNGIETARSLRSAYGERRPLLIALSGRSPLEDARQSAMFDHVIRKPIDAQSLFSMLAAI